MIISLKHMINTYSLNIKGVLHIGAHFGQEYDEYVNQGIKDMVFFEPIKLTYYTLFTNLQQKFKGLNIMDQERVLTFNIALGNENKEVEMFVESVNKGMSSSVLEPDLHLKQYPKIKFDKKETVQMCILDDIVIDRSKYNFINIDVQGYELEVFKGAVKTLKTIDYIYTEVNFQHLYKDCCLVEELDAFLKKFGFLRILTDSSNRTWGDALYKKYN